MGRKMPGPRNGRFCLVFSYAPAGRNRSRRYSWGQQPEFVEMNFAVEKAPWPVAVLNAISGEEQALWGKQFRAPLIADGTNPA